MCHEYSLENGPISLASAAAIYETWSAVSTAVECASL
jgi:hypothetical protein